MQTEASLVIKGKPRAVVILGRSATPTERHAAEELAKYVKAISGAALQIVTSDEWRVASKEQTAILVGRPATSPLIASLAQEGKVKLSSEDPGFDGFIIKTVTPSPARPHTHTIVLGGSRDRGTLYAVYHLLEKFCHVGFFWDGDQVPKQPTITLPTLDVAERPHFRERFSVSACGCAGTYSYGGYWGFEEWKQEIDWLAKNRFNAVLLTIGGGVVGKRAEEKMGLKPAPITEQEQKQSELAKQVFDHVRKLDLQAVTPFPSTQVSEAFRRAHPEGRYFVSGWFVEDDAGQQLPYHLYPTDPLFARWVETYIRTWNETYGSWHLYYGGDPYPEARFRTTDEERGAIQASLPVGVLQGIKAADPQGKWWLSGWAFVFDTGFWPKDTLHAFLQNMPAGDALIWDLWCDEHPVYDQERAGYFDGREFAFCVLHEFGGDDRLWGDLAKVVRQAKGVVTEERARNCVGFGLTTEVLHYNILYYDLLSKLAWNPTGVQLTSFLDDFTLRRYGRNALKTMRPAVQALADSVFGPAGSSEARYQHRLYLSENPHRSLSPAQALTALSKIEQFLRTGLSIAQNVSKDAQKGLRYNSGLELLQHDLVDAMRQYLTELTNLHLSLLDDAFAQGDEEAFEAEATVIARLLGELETILSSRSEYRLEATAEALARYPTNPPLQDLRKWLRDSGLTFAVAIPGIIDYQSKDIYELVKFYYRPRVEVFLGMLRGKLKPREFQVAHKELDDLYRPIELRWVKEGYGAEQAPPYKGTMWQAVREALARMQGDARIQLVRDTLKPRTDLVNGDFEEGLRGWSVRRQAGGDMQATGVGSGIAASPSGGKALFIRLAKPDGVYKAVEAWQNLVAPREFRLRFAYYIVGHTSLANVNVRVEGFDESGKKVLQAVYPFGGANWDYGNEKPEKTRGFFAVNVKLPSAIGKWLQAEINPRADVNRIHGEGVWDELHVANLRLAVGAWAYEGGQLSTEKNHYLEAFVDGVALVVG